MHIELEVNGDLLSFWILAIKGHTAPRSCASGGQSTHWMSGDAVARRRALYLGATSARCEFGLFRYCGACRNSGGRCARVNCAVVTLSRIATAIVKQEFRI